MTVWSKGKEEGFIMSKAMGQTATPADHLLGDFASLENMGGPSLSKEEKKAMNKEIGKFALSVMSANIRETILFPTLKPDYVSGPQKKEE